MPLHERVVPLSAAFALVPLGMSGAEEQSPLEDLGSRGGGAPIGAVAVGQRNEPASCRVPPFPPAVSDEDCVTKELALP